jgi:hypothetical protein
MSIQTIAYWGAFVIPVILLAVGAIIQKVVDAKPFERDHFYMGMDLTIYFLAATMVNFLDIAKEDHGHSAPIVWTVILMLSALVMLFVQIGMHQAWQGEQHKCKMQVFILCGIANSLGILLLYGFVRLKTRGLI